MAPAADKAKPRPLWQLVLLPIGFFMVVVFSFAWSGKRPANAPLIPIVESSRPLKKEKSDLGIDTRSVLDDVANLAPSKLLAQGKIDEAIGEALKQLHDHPTDIRMVMCTGNILAQVGDKDKGFDLLKESVKLAPESRYVRLNYASRLATAGRKPEAITQYQILCQNFPKQWIEPHFDLGRLYLEAGKFDRAIAEQKSVLDEQPENPLARQDLAFALAATGLNREAFAEFKKSALTPKDTKPYAVDARNILDRNHNVARRALGEMRVEVARHRADIPARVQFVELALFLNRESEARDVAKQALAIDPKNIQLHALLAEALVKLKQNEAAQLEFKKAAGLSVAHTQ